MLTICHYIHDVFFLISGGKYHYVCLEEQTKYLKEKVKHVNRIQRYRFLTDTILHWSASEIQEIMNNNISTIRLVL